MFLHWSPNPNLLTPNEHLCEDDLNVLSLSFPLRAKLVFLVLEVN